ncbi:hypothetical protein J4G33_06115 [Actinotalea sp. BY-33]|uniref:Uncharacterized protein n=1 Tax=Actinotalea soli TaxID=2819234 RepID=A0A939RTL0_9CELL|nr:hypothetical protein [Actinotalea soli]MBO1751374.1 hypothetical protein [Actinotalea soli]
MTDAQVAAWTDVPRPGASREQWVDWASRYNGYELLASHPAHLAAVLAPAREEFQATGQVPTWAGVHLLRGWLFLVLRAHRHAGVDTFAPEHSAEWFAVADRLRTLGRGARAGVTGRG